MPTSEPTDPKVSAWARLAHLAASAIGYMWTLIAALLAIVMAAGLANNSNALFASLLLMLSGCLTAARIVRWIRSKNEALKPWFAPPLVATLAAGVGFTVLGMGYVSPNVQHAGAAEAKRDRGALQSTQSSDLRSQSPIRQDHPLWPAQDALNHGQITEAVELFYSGEVTQSVRASAEGERLKMAIQMAMDQESGRGEDDIARRSFETVEKNLAGSWEPEPTASAIWERWRHFEDAARVLEEFPNSELRPEAQSERQHLKERLSRLQVADFPALRRSYLEMMRKALWEQDVEVSRIDDRSISYVGTVFAANRNIAEFQQGAKSHLDRLRFSKSRYSWSDGARWWQYRLATPADGVIGYWRGEDFVEIE